MAGLLRHYRIDRIERWESVLRLLLAMRPDCEKHPLEIIVREEDKEKSHDQRKLWHAMLQEFAQELGYWPEEMKQVVKRQFLGAKTIKVGGKDYEVIPSSEGLTRKQYSELIEFTYALAAEQGITLSQHT